MIPLRVNSYKNTRCKSRCVVPLRKEGCSTSEKVSTSNTNEFSAIVDGGSVGIRELKEVLPPASDPTLKTNIRQRWISKDKRVLKKLKL